jgi:hypothetical protein
MPPPLIPTPTGGAADDHTPYGSRVTSSSESLTLSACTATSLSRLCQCQQKKKMSTCCYEVPTKVLGFFSKKIRSPSNWAKFGKFGPVSTQNLNEI